MTGEVLYKIWCAHYGTVHGAWEDMPPPVQEAWDKMAAEIVETINAANDHPDAAEN